MFNLLKVQWTCGQTNLNRFEAVSVIDWLKLPMNPSVNFALIRVMFIET